MYSICMKMRHWATESAEQTPAAHSFIHFKMYWHMECHVPTNFSPLVTDIPDQSKGENLPYSKVLEFSRRDHYVSGSRRFLLKLL